MQFAQNGGDVRLTQNTPYNISGAMLTFIDDDGKSSFNDNWRNLAQVKGTNISIAALTVLVGTIGYLST